MLSREEGDTSVSSGSSDEGSPIRSRGRGVIIRDVTHHEDDEDEDDDLLHSTFGHRDRLHRMEQSLHMSAEISSPGRRRRQEDSTRSPRARTSSRASHITRADHATSSSSSHLRPTSSPTQLTPSSLLSSARSSPTSSGRYYPSRSLASHSAAPSAASESETVAQLRKQIAEHELTLVQERNKRFAAQSELRALQSQSSASPNTTVHSAASSATAAAAASDPTSKSPLFNQLISSSDSALWGKHLQATQAEQLRKVESLSSLLEEQTREMVALRAERNDFLRRHEAAAHAAHQQAAMMQQQMEAMQSRSESDRSRASHAGHQISLLQNELTMLDERARNDVAALLAKLEAAKQENAQVRSIYVQEKDRASAAVSDAHRANAAAAELHAQADQLRASADKYKRKARDLVARVRSEDAQREALQRQARDATDHASSLQDRLSGAQAAVSSQAAELSRLQSEHADLRAELLGKTTELTDLYAAYATAVETHQTTTRDLRTQMAQQAGEHAETRAERDAHARIAQIVRPLSHTMQLDLHRALAEKQSEVQRLQAELHSARITSDSIRVAQTPQDEQSLLELHTLRARLERKTAENVELATTNQELAHRLRVAERAQQQVAPIAPTHPPPQPQIITVQHPDPSQASPHLYRQIVELHESIATLEHRVAVKDSEVSQLRASSAVAAETRRALEEQVDQLSTHLDEFRARDLPTPAGFRAKKDAQRREWQAAMEEMRAAEEEWRRQVQRERDEMTAKAASEESFVAKAIAIHTEEIASEVDSLSALVSSRQHGLEPGIEHLIPKPQVYESTLAPQQTEEMLSKVGGMRR